MHARVPARGTKQQMPISVPRAEGRVCVFHAHPHLSLDRAPRARMLSRLSVRLRHASTPTHMRCQDSGALQFCAALPARAQGQAREHRSAITYPLSERAAAAEGPRTSPDLCSSGSVLTGRQGMFQESASTLSPLTDLCRKHAAIGGVLSAACMASLPRSSPSDL